MTLQLVIQNFYSLESRTLQIRIRIHVRGKRKIMRLLDNMQLVSIYLTFLFCSLSILWKGNQAAKVSVNDISPIVVNSPVVNFANFMNNASTRTSPATVFHGPCTQHPRINADTRTLFRIFAFRTFILFKLSSSKLCLK